MTKRTTHLRYVPEVTALCASVAQGLADVPAHPQDVKRLMGPDREQTADGPLAA